MHYDDRLTIVLTLKDRAPFTLRWMAYAEHVRLPFRVLIADGGTDQRVADLLSDPARFPSVRYEYVRYPADQSLSDYYRKLADATARVQTPYLVMGDNDDLFVVEGLLHCLDYLDAHPGVFGCEGEPVSFNVETPPALSNLHLVYGRARFHNAEFRQQPGIRSITGATAEQRVLSAMTAVSTWYAVFRSQARAAHYAILRDLNPTDLLVGEFMMMALSVVPGDLHREPILHLLRQADDIESSGRDTLRRADGFDRMLWDTWSHDFTNAVNAICRAVAAQDGISQDDLIPSIKAAYRAYFFFSGLGVELARQPPAMPAPRRANGPLARLAAADTPLRRGWRRLWNWHYQFSHGQHRVRWQRRAELRPIREFLAHPREIA